MNISGAHTFKDDARTQFSEEGVEDVHAPLQFAI